MVWMACSLSLSKNASQYDCLQLIPKGSIISPLPKEFERIFGKRANDFDRAILAMKMAKELGLVIILKGHFTLIAAPDGKGYFNPTGNIPKQSTLHN